MLSKAVTDDILKSFELAARKCQEVLEVVKRDPGADIQVDSLRVALELVKYGEYIKTTLIIHGGNVGVSVTKAAPKVKKVSAQDAASLVGASEEERAAVERTPPPGFVV